jgi:uncharacterized protein YecE (DUF72 family)
MKLYVGRNSLEGDIARYAKRFDVLELRTDGPRLPKPAKLREWVTKVPPHFVFSVVVPKSVAALTDSTPSAAGLEPALKSAEALNAKWFLIQSPVAVAPSQRMRDRLTQLGARLRETGQRVAWEPRGVWEDEQAEDFAESAELHLVRDLSRSDPPDTACVYTRLLALGDGVRVRPSAALRVSEGLEGREEAFVIIEGKGAMGARKLLRSELAQARSGADSEDDEDFEDESADGEVEDELDEDDSDDDVADDDEE